MEQGILYFYTSTVLNWQHLFVQKIYKDIIIDSLSYLSNNQLLIIYGFVIMPNHIHLLLEIPGQVQHPHKVQHSFMSFTAHQFKKVMKCASEKSLSKFQVNAKDRQYQFWERNPKLIAISDFNMAGNIVNYMHSNPLQSKWNLAQIPEKYHYSSAAFYDDGTNDFGILNHYMDYFNRSVEL